MVQSAIDLVKALPKSCSLHGADISEFNRELLLPDEDW